MKRDDRQSGFSLVELLVSLAVLFVTMSALATLLIQNARINRSQQMTMATQSTARSCVSMIVPVLRSAGWDPMNAGFTPVSLDTSGNGTWIRVFADLNEDGDTADVNEDVTIRYQNNRIEWRTTSDTTQPFVALAEDITNDADGNGSAEPMFVPNSLTKPTRITVQVTARSPVPDPRTGQYVRHTVATDVILRRNL